MKKYLRRLIGRLAYSDNRFGQALANVASQYFDWDIGWGDCEL